MKRILPYIVIAAISVSCSTTRVLKEGQARLVSNRVEVTNDDDFNASELTPYLKQRTASWSPFLYVYNWEDGKGKGWDKFVHKIGVAPVIYDSTLVNASLENIGNHLEYMGYYGSDVSSSTTFKNKKAKVHYSVTLGKRYPIKQISYEIPYENDFAKEFFSDTVNSLIRAGDYLSEAVLEAETVRGASAMRNKGYYDFSRNYYYFEADTVSVPDSAYLRLIVKNRPRNGKSDTEREFYKYNFGKVIVSYPEKMKFRNKVFKNINVIHTGDQFTEKGVNTEYSRLGSLGIFSAVNINLEPDEQKRTVDCNIRLQQSKYQGFKVGIEASINSTGLFGVSPEISYFNKNIFKGGEQLNISMSTNHQFKFGNTSIHSNEVSVNASLTFPNFVPFPSRWLRSPNLPKTIVKAAYNYQDRPEFTRNSFSASFGYTGKLFKKAYYQLNPISLNFIYLPYMNPEFAKSISRDPFQKNAYENHFDMGINGTLYYSDVENPTPQTSYWYARLGTDLSGNFLSLFSPLMAKNGDGKSVILGMTPYSQYVRVELNLGKTFVWGDNLGQSLATHLMIGAGYAYGNSFSIPFEKMFYGGGANSLRGWAARTVGPGTSKMDSRWSIPNQTGDFKLEANLEYRFHLFWKLAGAVFLDAGNIWNIQKTGSAEKDMSQYLVSGNFFPALAFNWGAGIRLDFSFMVLRVDLGMRLHDPAALDNGDFGWVGPAWWFKNNYAVHFGVGFPF